MKLLFVTGEYPPMRGGVGDYTAQIASRLSRQGLDVGILTSTGATGASTPGVQIYPALPGWGFRAWQEVAARAGGYDIVHIQYQAGAFGMRPAAQFLPDIVRLLAGKPVLTTFHDLRVPYLFPKAGPLRAWSVRHLARASDGVITTNAEDEATLQAQGVTPLWQIPLGSNVPSEPPATWDRDAWRARWNIPPEHRLVVHFGFVNRSKNIEALLRAHEGLLRAGQPVCLLMLGEPLGASDPSNVAYLEEIKARAAELELVPPWFQWTGNLPAEEITCGLLAADLVVLPYRDGASLRRGTLAAPLALGRPVLTTEPVTPLPAFQDGHNIALARRGDPGDLARRMALLLRYEPSLRRLERAAGALASLFDWDVIAARHLEVYQSLPGAGR
jgi:glycosyltransferase involved in cell wall biosynthesis